MNTEHNSYNGFYNDPKYPQGFRLIRVNQDASVTIYGKDSQNEKVWCISGTLNDDNTIVLNDTSENPAFDKYNATLEDGRLLWFNSEKNQPESQWEKKKLTQGLLIFIRIKKDLNMRGDYLMVIMVLVSFF